MIIAVGAWRGVGATTTALLLATSLAERSGGAWLIEADPAGGVLSARSQLPTHSIAGLERVAFPSERGTAGDGFKAVAHQVGNLSVVATPADPFRAFACHSPRMPWTTALHDLGGDVVVDVGRLRAGSPVWSILSVADQVLVVSSPEVTAAVTTAEWVKSAGRVSPADPGLLDAKAQVVFVDSPCGVSFTRPVLQADMPNEFAAWLPWEPATVDLVHRGATGEDRRVRRSALMAAVGQLADHTSKEIVR